MTEAITLTAAYILDLAVGDPRWIPHPVRCIGWMTEKMEGLLRREDMFSACSQDNRGVIPAKAGIQGIKLDAPVRPKHDGVRSQQRKNMLAGILLVVIIVGGTYGLFYFINHLLLASRSTPLTFFLSSALLVILIATTIATRELITSAQAVIDEVRKGDIEEARARLGMIVGRDTHSLDGKGVLRAAVETLAENASDGIIAPLFYFAVGGLPLAMAYKAVNTLDSMIGYKNETYRYFGWAAARLDDIANYIPARITGMLIVVSSYFIHYSPVTAKYSFKTMMRDGRRHSSPNSGVPEAAMAGALGMRLGGPSMYGGVPVEKPVIGDERAEAGSRGAGEKEEIYLHASVHAISIVRTTSLIGFGLALVLLYGRRLICCG